MTFELAGSMTGSYRLAGSDVDRPLGFTFACRSPTAFWRALSLEIEGEIDAVGFADKKRARGSIDVAVVARGAVPIEISFVANDGRACALRGESSIDKASIVESLSVLGGHVLDASGARVGSALLRFDVRSSLFGLVRSVRLR